MAVQEAVERSSQKERGIASEVADGGSVPEVGLSIEFGDESRVEQIRARVRELNEQYGHEITPMAMFSLIKGEFRQQSSRRD